MDTEAYIRNLELSIPMRKKILAEAMNALDIPPGSWGLDVGCGIGLQVLKFAEIVGPEGHVTGFDISTDFLRRAEELARKVGVADRVSFKQGDAAALPFDDETLDWVWSADCVGYGPFDTLALLKEIKRVLKPGGIVALFAWSSEQLLPGYPFLEGRLRLTSAGAAPFTAGRDPGLHFLRASGWFRDLGFNGVQSRVFADSVSAPLSDELYRALTDLFDMRWPGVETELPERDRVEFLKLCKEDSPEYILKHPDYHAFYTCSMFSSKK